MSARRVAKKPPEKAPSFGEVVSLHGRRATAGDRSRAPAAALLPGAHFAKLLKKLGDGRYEAQVIGGGRFEVGIAPEVDMELADLCLAEQVVVLVGRLGHDVAVFGALQTRAKKPDEVVIEAPRKLTLRVGKSRLVLSADGKIKLSGNDVTVDAPREVRLASARVEIP